jgi:Lon protease-like protein
VEIPLFPLPAVVLFPSIHLPLHIFEERYKVMINECIESREPFGLVLLREGAQEETEQTIHRTGTSARVLQVERLAAGRMNILCAGEFRFRVFRFVSRTPYWKGSVDFFDDDPVDEESLRLLREDLSALYVKAFALGVELNLVPASELKLPDSSRELSFMLSYALDIDAESKQKLLELKSTEQRLRELLVYTEDAVRKLERQLAYKRVVRKVRGNGDLGRPGSSTS